MIETVLPLASVAAEVPFMRRELFEILGANVTPWKIVGYSGAFLFASRWFVQVWYSKKMRRAVLPPLFWYMSLVGSGLTLTYFIWGKNDSVGILQNLFPAFVASYNLWLEFSHRRRAGDAGAGPATPPGS